MSDILGVIGLGIILLIAFAVYWLNRSYPRYD